MLETLTIFCKKNKENYCGNAIASNHTKNIINNCNISSNDSCGSECSSAVESVTSELGCCAHALTLPGVSEWANVSFLNSQLWTQCHVESPSQKCSPDSESLSNNNSQKIKIGEYHM